MLSAQHFAWCTVHRQWEYLSCKPSLPVYGRILYLYLATQLNLEPYLILIIKVEIKIYNIMAFHIHFCLMQGG